jgi:hypothetical protein
LFITLYPVPAWPFSIAPYLFLTLLLIGFAYMQWLESRDPGALLRGAAMLVGEGHREDGAADR